MNTQKETRNIAMTAMFAAIICVLAFTPIGYLDLPFIKATIIHIPVIIGSILLGARYGALLGLLFGITSLIRNTTGPSALSFAFSPFIPTPITGEGNPSALIVCLVPRILVGVFPRLVYIGLKKFFKSVVKAGSRLEPVYLCLADIVGSLTNTILVMHFIFIFFKDSFAARQNVAIDTVYSVLLGIIAANGIPEAIAAAILTTAVCMPVMFVRGKM
jgi:uncharacterized membrane protein